MEHENKTRIPAWLRPSTIRRMDGWLEEANCKSRSEFIEKSLHFYMGYLGAEDASVTRISNKKIWQRGSNKSNNYTRKKVGNNWKDKFISSVIIIILLFSNM